VAVLQTIQVDRNNQQSPTIVTVLRNRVTKVACTAVSIQQSTTQVAVSFHFREYSKGVWGLCYLSVCLSVCVKITGCQMDIFNLRWYLKFGVIQWQ